MWEVWFTIDNISRVALRPSEEAAVQAGLRAFMDDKAVFDYLVDPEGALRNDLVYAAIKGEQRKRGREKIKQWVIELKATHRDDFWAVVDESNNFQQVTSKADQLALAVGGDRVRIRDIQQEG